MTAADLTTLGHALLALGLIFILLGGMLYARAKYDYERKRRGVWAIFLGVSCMLSSGMLRIVRDRGVGPLLAQTRDWIMILFWLLADNLPLVFATLGVLSAWVCLIAMTAIVLFRRNPLDDGYDGTAKIALGSLMAALVFLVLTFLTA